jgi:chromosome segregation ATPase
MWALVACQSGPSQQFIQKVTGELEDLQKAVDQAKGYSEKVANLKKSLEDLKAELDKNWEKVEKDKDLSAQYQALLQQIAELEGQVGTVASELQSAISGAQAFKDSLPQQKKKDEELDKEWSAIREKVSGPSGKLGELGQKLSSLEGEVNKFVEAVKGKFAQAKK